MVLEQYVPNVQDRLDPRVSPLLAKTCEGCHPPWW